MTEQVAKADCEYPLDWIRERGKDKNGDDGSLFG